MNEKKDNQKKYEHRKTTRDQKKIERRLNFVLNKHEKNKNKAENMLLIFCK